WVGGADELGRPCGARLTGMHGYAARLHDYRFKQMEYTLPEEYKDENELERQRKIHDSLIAMGLQLISESYLDVMAKKAAEAELDFEPKMIDGKHYKVLIEDCLASDYDLVVMGAQVVRSEEHTSELQSHLNLVCRLLLEKKKKSRILKHTE